MPSMHSTTELYPPLPVPNFKFKKKWTINAIKDIRELIKQLVTDLAQV